jgi:undecaprenyl diphosphate synthase
MVPNHVGIIMDGNGRWATQRGLKRSAGHKAGAKNLRNLSQHIFKSGVKCLSLYAFSTENFKRDKEEVDYLMNLLVQYFNSEKENFVKNETKVVFSGTRDNLSPEVLNAMDETARATKNFTERTINICFNYGGRLEIVDATKKICQKVMDGTLKIEDINEEVFDDNLYNKLPPVDYVIRTSGEQRISNFLLWEASYAEYYFPKVLFPDFDEKEFDKALEEYENRNRRFGG